MKANFTTAAVERPTKVRFLILALVTIGTMINYLDLSLIHI